MTIEKIKNNIDSKLGDNVKIIYNGSRNKKEEYSGIISETYNYIFIIKTDSDEVKSFSYRDVLTNTIELFLINCKIYAKTCFSLLNNIQCN